MSTPKNVDVELGSRGYTISIDCGLHSRMANALREVASSRRLKTEHAFVVSDKNVAQLYLDSIVSDLSQIFERVNSFVVPAGEASKSINWLEQLWHNMLESGTDRSSVLFALGGGVVGDLAGFGAASFGRGIPFIQIPTTLLAQVDSSVGGKVGINLPGAKNMVGAFWQPTSVLIDPTFLQTLSARDFRGGLAEVVKYGVIMDAEFFALLENSIELIVDQDPATLTKIISRCCQLKADVVVADETETSGRRAILNYGHTFGHAIENIAGYGQYSHGEAISIGMHCAAKVALELERVDQAFVERQAKLLTAFGLPVELSAPTPEFVEKLVAAMKHDKKTDAGELRLVLPSCLGSVELVAAPANELLRKSFLTSESATTRE